MKIKIDFQLNRQFGVVERIIFRLVLNGFTDAREIARALPVFSDSVIGNGIKQLVNRQLLTASIESGKLSLSEPLIAIIDTCIENSYDIEVPSELEDYLKKDGLLLSGVSDELSHTLIQAILFELLPGIKLDMYVDTIDFILYEEGGGQHE